MSSAISVIPLLMFLSFRGCGEENLLKGTPECVKMKIDWITNQDVWNPPAKLYSYLYEGKTVYYIPGRCCDFPSQLLDTDCNEICAPDGGFSGGGDGKCPDFSSTRTDEKLVWEDSRKFPD